MVCLGKQRVGGHHPCSRLPTQYPLGAHFDIGPEVRFVHEEDLGFACLSVDAQGRIVGDERVPLQGLGNLDGAPTSGQ
jgi:hypothetical protein